MADVERETRKRRAGGSLCGDRRRCVGDVRDLRRYLLSRCSRRGCVPPPISNHLTYVRRKTYIPFVNTHGGPRGRGLALESNRADVCVPTSPTCVLESTVRVLSANSSSHSRSPMQCMEEGRRKKETTMTCFFSLKKTGSEGARRRFRRSRTRKNDPGKVNSNDLEC